MYEVLDVTMYGVKVKPLDNAPRVSEWQPKHKVFLAPPRFNDDDFMYDIDAHTGLAIAPGASHPEARVQADVPLAPLQVAGPPADKDGEYEVESVLSAVKRSGRWYLTIKWVGYAETTEETRTWLKQAASPTVVAMAEEAIARAMLRKRNVAFTELHDDVEDEDEDDPDKSMYSTYAVHHGDDAATAHCVMRAAQSIIITRMRGADHVLLLLRKATPGKPACWFFPGGKCESDESFMSACQRELHEETGAQLPIDAFQECWSSTGTKLGKFWTLRDFVARIEAQAAECFINMEPDKHDKLMWMPVSQALQLTSDEQLDRVPERVRAAIEANGMCTKGTTGCCCARCLVDAAIMPSSTAAARRMKSVLHVHLRFW
ncbi:MAG: NUDIX domain-containing protein [Proteobacteria bacterium]|nr:NUDIX domain-containing protein [Pseudomonadota bacterium]